MTARDAAWFIIVIAVLVTAALILNKQGII